MANIIFDSCEQEKNFIYCGKNVNINGKIKGIYNRLHIDNFEIYCNISINIHGDNNTIFIEPSKYLIKKLSIQIGNYKKANNTKFFIGSNFQSENVDVLLYNPQNKIFIDNNCMFSSNITIRLGELPHLIFDYNTGDYVDTSSGVYIGKHVWIGQNVYITKKSSIPNGCIVAANSVVTKNLMILIL